MMDVVLYLGMVLMIPFFWVGSWKNEITFLYLQIERINLYIYYWILLKIVGEEYLKHSKQIILNKTNTPTWDFNFLLESYSLQTKSKIFRWRLIENRREPDLHHLIQNCLPGHDAVSGERWVKYRVTQRNSLAPQRFSF